LSPFEFAQVGSHAGHALIQGLQPADLELLAPFDERLADGEQDYIVLEGRSAFSGPLPEEVAHASILSSSRTVLEATNAERLMLSRLAAKAMRSIVSASKRTSRGFLLADADCFPASVMNFSARRSSRRVGCSVSGI
jgi:hypothetical protein